MRTCSVPKTLQHIHSEITQQRRDSHIPDTGRGQRITWPHHVELSAEIAFGNKQKRGSKRRKLGEWHHVNVVDRDVMVVKRREVFVLASPNPIALDLDDPIPAIC